jgi:hypothetical protein
MEGRLLIPTSNIKAPRPFAILLKENLGVVGRKGQRNELPKVVLSWGLMNKGTNQAPRRGFPEMPLPANTTRGKPPFIRTPDSNKICDQQSFGTQGSALARF